MGDIRAFVKGGNMGKVILDMSMSLDGYIAGADGEDVGLYNWYFAPADADPSGKNAFVIQETIDILGAIIMGRNTYGTGEEQDGFEDSPYHAVNVVLTHHPPEQQPEGFVFVNEGIERALEQARAAAGDKDIAIGGGANVAQQYLRAGLVDEIQIHFVPMLLGKGVRLFDHLAAQNIQLEITRVLDAAGVTHIRYTVVK
jgi:dihydrofolate reductase